MPSASYITFLHIREDVRLLRSNYLNYEKIRISETENGDHLIRSAILTLCAGWERYNEDILLECIKFLSASITNTTNLETSIQKKISAKVRNEAHELKPIELAGEGWKLVWLNYAKEETEILNTPNAQNLRLLFRDYLGIDDISRNWRLADPDIINQFVKARGDIAHNGNQATPIPKEKLFEYLDAVTDSVINMDGSLADYLTTKTNSSNSPWEKNYFWEIASYSGLPIVGQTEKQ